MENQLLQRSDQKTALDIQLFLQGIPLLIKISISLSTSQPPYSFPSHAESSFPVSFSFLPFKDFPLLPTVWILS